MSLRFALRVAAGVLVVAGTGLTGSVPASAHTYGTYRTVVTQINPHLLGVRVTVSSDGHWLRLVNTTATPLLLLDDDHLPVARVDAAGAWRRAPDGPGWRRRSTSPALRVQDLRVPRVPAARGPRPGGGDTTLVTWRLPLRYGSQLVTVRGRLLWEPTPFPWGQVALLSAFAVSFLALVGVAAHRDGQRRSLVGRRPHLSRT